jgi:two-component system sensor histidine kinase CiaH
MFHKASLRLATFYLAIIMAISLFFSFNLYHVSVQEFDRQLGRQNNFLQDFSGFPSNFEQRFFRERQMEFSDAKGRVLSRLILINLLILLGGGILSYYLAKLTLRPIEEAHDAQSRFTADASHELRTPIAAMRSEIEVALMNSKLTLPQAKELLNSNLEELEKLTALSEGMLSLARLENQEAVMQPVDIEALCKAAISQTLPLAEQKNILITSDIQPNLKTVGDNAGLTEVLVILLDNAIKYSPNNTEVTLSAKSDQKQILLVVTDQGQGIKSAELPHIFERFYRADVSRSKSENEPNGYGLGLSIAKRMVKMHNGTISAKSKLKHGTIMTVKLPYNKQTKDQ